MKQIRLTRTNQRIRAIEGTNGTETFPATGCIATHNNVAIRDRCGGDIIIEKASRRKDGTRRISCGGDNCCFELYFPATIKTLEELRKYFIRFNEG